MQQQQQQQQRHQQQQQQQQQEHQQQQLEHQVPIKITKVNRKDQNYIDKSPTNAFQMRQLNHK